MNEGATTEVIESHPTANANVPRSSDVSDRDARMHAGRESAGPRRRKGLRTLTRSETQPSTTAAMPAARENNANKRPKTNESLASRNEPSGVLTESNPSTPSSLANSGAVREPIRLMLIT